jgi:hypothetical protein
MTIPDVQHQSLPLEQMIGSIIRNFVSNSANFSLDMIEIVHQCVLLLKLKDVWLRSQTVSKMLCID